MASNYDDMINGMILATIILIVVMLPRWCCKVEKDEYEEFIEKYKEEHPEYDVKSDKFKKQKVN